MRNRLRIIFIMFFIMWGGLLFRGFQLKMFTHDRIESSRTKQYERIVSLKAKRGDILDRNNNELAISVPAYSLFADPKIIKNKSKTALKLSRIINLPYKKILKKINKKEKRFVWLQRRLGADTKSLIDQLKIRGLGFKEEFKRVYPNKNLLSHVMGFVGNDQSGLEGIEAKYNKILTSSDNTHSVMRDARGRFVVQDGWMFIEHTDGEDIFLTIDSDLQHYVESQLRDAVDYHKAKSAWAVVLDPNTSEVLSLASYPDFNPNQLKYRKKSQRRNRALSDIYEPGSTMKTLFMAAAMKDGAVHPNTIVKTGESIKLNGHTIKESDKKHIYKQLTASEILSRSSNVGISKLSLRMSDQILYDFFTDFGFGSKTMVDLPGEASGILRKPPWKDHLKANISFGHGVAVNALQIANAYAAIANGGILRKPYLVKSRRGLEGRRDVNRPHFIRRVLSPSVATKLRVMLMAVTAKDGTGEAARVSGYPVAGKTGTAQKVKEDGRGYEKGEYISSFVGFLPVNKPRYVIYIAIDTPIENGYYASQTAAPVFSKIADYAMNRSGIAPVAINESSLVVPSQKNQEKSSASLAVDTLPDMTSWTTREVLRFSRKHQIKVQWNGRKQGVGRTDPPEGASLAKLKVLKVYSR